MKGFILHIIFIIIAVKSLGQALDIGIMRDYTITTVEFTHHKGNYMVYGDTLEGISIHDNQSFYAKRSGEKIKLVKNSKTIGYFDTIWVTPVNINSSIKVQCLTPSSKKSRRYNDTFIITPEDQTNLKVINRVEMHNYLGGVIESEGGGGKHLEYYKVQAILSRTYALGHLTKHRKEGFQLCDRVHCQAYHNMLIYTDRIRDAVEATKGLVMLNNELRLAQGFFFANCGGQTSEADFVWNNAVAHCKSVKDTFCTKSWQATWEKRINATTWKNYMADHFGYPVNDPELGPLIFNFQQPHRMAFYQHPQLGIPLRDIRIKFRLKSTWFSCHKEGNEVVLTGKGFGHGVGLCQEGAMGMAKHGYTARQILNFYFTGVQLMNYYNWSFYNKQAIDVGLDL